MTGSFGGVATNVLGEEVEYQYDSIHRLVSAGVDPNASLATAPLWGQSYADDGFGNLKQKVGHAAAQYTGFDLALHLSDEWRFTGGRSWRY